MTKLRPPPGRLRRPPLGGSAGPLSGSAGPLSGSAESVGGSDDTPGRAPDRPRIDPGAWHGATFDCRDPCRFQTASLCRSGRKPLYLRHVTALGGEMRTCAHPFTSAWRSAILTSTAPTRSLTMTTPTTWRWTSQLYVAVGDTCEPSSRKRGGDLVCAWPSSEHHRASTRTPFSMAPRAPPCDRHSGAGAKPRGHYGLQWRAARRRGGHMPRRTRRHRHNWPKRAAMANH